MKIFNSDVFASSILQIFTNQWRHKGNSISRIWKKVPTWIKNILCLNNDWNVIFSKAEKNQICGKTVLAPPSYMVGIAYCLLQENRKSDMSVLY